MAIKVGLVGLGFMGAAHARIYQAEKMVELAAVCDIRPGQMQGAATSGNIDTGPGGLDLSRVRKYSDFRELLADRDVDMIDVCTPTFLHASMSVAAMEAGKHCFCEKPMALTWRDAARMSEVSKKTGRALMVGHCLRFWPEYVAIKEMIDSGRFGAVRAATFRRVGGAPAWSWENWFLDSARSGHAALDLHIHDVDVVQWFFGAPASVTARGSITADNGINHIHTQYHFPGIGLVTAEAGWFHSAFPFSMSAVVAFEKVTVEYSNLHTPSLAIYTAGGKETPAVPAGDAYANELSYFLDCLGERTPPDRVMPETSAQAVRIVDAEMQSVRSGKAVAL